MLYDINSIISNAFSATQIIIVFITILFNIFYIDYSKKIKERLSLKNDEKEKYCNELKSLRNVGHILILIFFVVLAVFFQLFVTILYNFISQVLFNTHNFLFWALFKVHGIEQQTFVVITFLIILFFGLTIDKVRKINKRISFVETKVKK